MTTKKAMDHLINQLNEDPAYRNSWQANIAMAFIDEARQDGCSAHDWLHRIGNAAAKRFLDHLCRPTDDRK